MNPRSDAPQLEEQTAAIASAAAAVDAPAAPSPANPVETRKAPADLKTRVLGSVTETVTTVTAPLSADAKAYQANAAASVTTGVVSFSQLLAGDYACGLTLMMASLYFGAGAVRQYGVDNSRKYVTETINSAGTKVVNFGAAIKNYGTFAYEQGANLYHMINPPAAQKMKRN
jgi:hypothetical protein